MTERFTERILVRRTQQNTEIGGGKNKTKIALMFYIVASRIYMTVFKWKE